LSAVNHTARKHFAWFHGLLLIAVACLSATAAWSQAGTQPQPAAPEPQPAAPEPQPAAPEPQPAATPSPQTTASLETRAKAALATLSGSLHVPGLHHAVQVKRDRWGVAHIYAADQHDLFFAQGFVVAQDRLFQMEMWKRSGQGRLAEVLGPQAVRRDLNARRLRYRGDMQAEFASYSPDTREILEAFTGGINAYIARLQVPGGPGLPVEFQIAGFRPEAWTPADCLNRMAAYSMTSNASRELLHAQVLTLLGTEAASRLFDLDPKVELDPIAGVDYAGLVPALLDDLTGSDVRTAFEPKLLTESNDWAVSGALTASGKPLLANDPHRVIAEPSLRYIVHLVAPGWNVIGAGEPALPGVAVGHNDDIAWGFTIFGLDQQDLYLEELNPKQPLQYATENGWQPMQVSNETIAVRGAAPMQVQIKFTRHGPVLWEDGRRALALRWVGDEPGSAGYLASLALDRARNWQDFEAAMPRWKVPSENIVYADRAGNIGEHSTGLAPWRKNWTGLLPVPGNGQYEWAGFLRNDELPHSFNPAAGFVATANQRMVPQDYPYAVGFEWADPVRFQRITQVLEEAKSRGQKLQVADMQNLQSDVVSLLARDLQALLRGAHLSAQNSAAERASLQMMLDWDGVLRADSPQAALFEFWLRELQKELAARLVPESARAALGDLTRVRLRRELMQPRAEVFGAARNGAAGGGAAGGGAAGGAAGGAVDAGADPAGLRDALLLTTLGHAREQLIAARGPDDKQWAWGALHTVTFRHALDGLPATAALFDRGPLRRSGDGEAVQATSFSRNSLEQTAGASYREIFDLADWDASVGINVPGQSGQPSAKHYDDLLPLWLEGRYFPLSYSKQAVDTVTSDVLDLRP
jgi:penicillin G amidase